MKDKMTEIEVVSTIDGSPEKSLLWFPEGQTNVPLVTGLHTWSADRFNQVETMLPFCMERKWALILPEFRGPNLDTNPRALQACASNMAKQDVIDAVSFVTRSKSVDKENIFLIGGSGGGHMSLMMAAYAPELWKGVSSWVPVTDLAAWHGENQKYARHVEACCGGKPGASEKTDRFYAEKSPLSYITELLKANIFVHHGRYDNSVPYTHTARLARIMESAGASTFYFEIFDGAHELLCDEGFKWFDYLYCGKKSRKQATG
jgi:dipeptidyl aminopeptidase/acylaminoacyl peptidase